MKEHYKNSNKLIEDFFIIGIDNKEISEATSELR